MVAILLATAGCEIGVEPSPDQQLSDAPFAADGSAVAPQSPAATALRPVAPRPQISRGHLKFVEGFQAGYAKAAGESKPMLLFFTAEWCHYCHQMADESFTHPQVVALAERFVCILIDADAEPKVCQQFQISGFPTVQLLSPRGAPLTRLVGKKPGHQLMMAMQAALQSVARRDDGQEEIIVR
jgi:thiol:disulfide interchange protein